MPVSSSIPPSIQNSDLAFLDCMCQTDWLCSNAAAISDLGIKPQYDLHKGMAATIKWYIDNGYLT